ncbi:MAG: hypothetical protein ACE5HN_09420, partial [Nitrospiria bacterium]
VYKFGLIEPVKKLSQIGWKIDTWVFDGLVNASSWATLLVSKLSAIFDTLIVDGVVNASGWATRLESRISEIFDIRVVDGAVNGVSSVLDGSARRLRRIQTGAFQNYVLAMIVGIVLLSFIFIVVR